MCGLSFVLTKKLSEGAVQGLLNASNDMQLHRGPDMQDTQIFRWGEYAVGFSHQRLSILDLSDAGKQPMSSKSGRYAIVFNGEIYNYKELADKYDLHPLSSGTDTEVVIEVIERIGPLNAFKEFNGMWAIVIFDRLDGQIYVSRDRAGIKPLYYLENDAGLFVASEFKTVLEISGQKCHVDELVVGQFLCQSLQNISDRTWVKEVKHFPPSCFSIISLKNNEQSFKSFENYWGFEPGDRWAGGFEEYVEELSGTFKDAVKIRMRSDVPIGLTLSGGLDSSIIAAEIHGMSKNKGFNVISAVSPGTKHDESKFIDIVGNSFNLSLSKIELDMGDPEQIINLLKKTTWVNDAPIASFSNVLFYLLMEQAKRLDTKVIFSGQGADELFCGYRKFPAFQIKSLIQQKRFLEAIFFGMPFLKNGTVFNQFNIAEAKRYLSWGKKDTIAGDQVLKSFTLEKIGYVGDSMNARQWQDYRKYSVPYLTHYEDRMSMAFGREVRLPFLDYRVVELALQSPVSYKMKDGWTKYCLRKAYESKLPPSIVWRKDKQGFVNPQDMWLKNELKSYVLSVIDNKYSPVFEKGLVDRLAYKELFYRYCNGDKRVWFRDVFSPLSLNIWLEGYSKYLH